MSKKNQKSQLPAEMPEDAKSPHVRTFEWNESLDSLAAELEIDLAIQPEEQFDRAVHKTNAALRLVVEAGLDFLSLKASLPHGHFHEALAERGIAKQRAHEAMSLAVYASRQPAKERKALLSMGKRKALILARTEQPVIDALMEEIGADAISDLDTLTVSDLVVRVASLNQKNANLSEKLKTAQAVNTAHEQRNQQKFKDLPYAPWALASREETAVHSDACWRALDGLGRVLENMELSANSLTHDDREYLATAGLTYFNLAGILARAQQLLESARDFMPDAAMAGLDLAMPLSRDEQENLLQIRADLMSTEQAEEMNRARDRDAKQKRRGRPTKAPEVFPK